MAIERRRERPWRAAVVTWLACTAMSGGAMSVARAEDPAAAAPAEGKSGGPKAVRQMGGERGQKIEMKRAAQGAAKDHPGLHERIEKMRAMRGHPGGPMSGHPPSGRQGAAEAANGDEGAEAELTPEQRAQRRLERSHRARRMHWRAMMQHVRRPSEIPPEVRNELRHHARRLARLKRIDELAKEKGDTKAVARVGKLIAREHERHGRRMHEHFSALAKAKAAAAPPAADPQVAAPAAEAKPPADDPDPETAEAEEEEQGGEP